MPFATWIFFQGFPLGLETGGDPLGALAEGSMAMTQEPIKIGGTDSIYKAYFLGLCKKNIPTKYSLI